MRFVTCFKKIVNVKEISLCHKLKADGVNLWYFRFRIFRKSEFLAKPSAIHASSLPYKIYQKKTWFLALNFLCNFVLVHILNYKKGWHHHKVVKIKKNKKTGGSSYHGRSNLNTLEGLLRFTIPNHLMIKQVFIKFKPPPKLDLHRSVCDGNIFQCSHKYREKVLSGFMKL